MTQIPIAGLDPHVRAPNVLTRTQLEHDVARMREGRIPLCLRDLLTQMLRSVDGPEGRVILISACEPILDGMARPGGIDVDRVELRPDDHGYLALWLTTTSREVRRDDDNVSISRGHAVALAAMARRGTDSFVGFTDLERQVLVELDAAL